MQSTERPIDLSAARTARALAHPATVGDRWAELHGIAARSVPQQAGSATVVRLRPGR